LDRLPKIKTNETKSPTPELRAGIGKRKFFIGRKCFTKNAEQKIHFRKGADSVNASAEKLKSTQEPQHFKRRIGSTVFRVAVHFNPEAKETAEVKISRLVRMEADSKKVGDVC